MTKRIRKIAAAIAAGVLALTQISMVMPTASADFMWDLDWKGNWFNPGQAVTEPESTAVSATAETSDASTEASVSAAVAVTSATTAATAVTAVTSSTASAAKDTASTPKATASTPKTTASTSKTTASSAKTSITTPTTSVTSVSSATSVTSGTSVSSVSSSASGTSAAAETSTGFHMPEDPDMPDFSYLGAVGCLTQMQTEFIARSVFKCCKNPDAYPREKVGDKEGERRMIDVEFDELGFMLADPEHLKETQRSISCVINTVIYNHKECMLADLSYGYNTRREGNGKPKHFCGIYLRFTVPDQMYTRYYNDVQTKFDAIVSQADDSWTDLEKALFFHDYMAIHYNYDFASATPESNGSASHYAYGMLNEKRGVCQAYAWLYNLLLNESGVESYFVSAVVPDPDSSPDDPVYLLNHAWNLVRIDGHWYHVDTTFDDQGTGRQVHQDPDIGLPGDWLLGFAGQVGHEEFMVSTNGLLSSDSQYVGSSEYWTTSLGESAYDLADSDLLDTGFWREAKSAVVPYLGGWLVKTNAPDDPANKQKAAYFLYTREPDGDYSAEQLFVEQSDWRWKLRLKPGKPDKFQSIDNASTYCLYGELILYTVDGGKGLRYACVTEKDNIAASIADRWLLNGEEFGMDPDDCIYGLVVEDDVLRLFTSRSPSDAPVEIDIPIADLQERLNNTTSELLPGQSGSVPIIAGDFSGDGELNVVDVVCMARYLLASKPAAEPDTLQRMDLIPDNVIDIYDLAKLKWLLLHKK